MHTLRSIILNAIDTYKAEHGLSDTALSVKAQTDPRTIGRLRKGKSVGLDLLEQIYDLVGRDSVALGHHGAPLAPTSPSRPAEQSPAIPARPLPTCPGLTTSGGA